MWFALVGLGIGIGLLAWGWRGRAIDDHPLCRKCRYDLTTVYPDRPACPECGADTTVDGAVRFGHRRKRSAPLWVGVVLILLSTTWLIKSAAGVDLTKYKPTWVLRLEALRADEQAARVALDELLDRMSKQRLSAAQITSLVEDALSVQADTTRPWLGRWGDVVVAAHRMGLVTPKQFARYGPPLGIPHVTVRPKVSQGKPVPITFGSGGRGRQSEGPGTQGIYAGLALRRVEIDGAEISGDRVTSSRSTWQYGGSRTRQITEAVELSVGQHTLRFTFDFHLLDGLNESVLTQWKKTVEVSFEVVPADEPTVRLVTDSAARQQLADQSSVEIRIWTNGTAQRMIWFPPLDFAIVADVWIKTDQRTENVGNVQARRLPHRHGHGQSVPIQAVDGQVLEVILRPNIGLAERTSFASEIWGEEIVIRDIDVRDDRPKASGAGGQ